MAELKAKVDAATSGDKVDTVVKCPVCRSSHIPRDGAGIKNGVYAASCENCGFFFKFRVTLPTADYVSFTVNGQHYTVTNDFDPATSLNEYLRTMGVSRGTKQMCIEGGCGVCLVVAKLYDPVLKKPVTYTVNSCLVQVYMCDQWEITTVEGLGNSRDGLHPVQSRLVQYNGSQCGFCSPAQVMNMYGLLQKTPSPTMQQVEDQFDCTICRCTGYRSILDAMKSFCADASADLPGGQIDIEDLDGKICSKSNLACRRQHQNRKNCSSKTTESGEHRAPGVTTPLHIVGATSQWFKPTSVTQLYNLLDSYRDQNYRLVFGNTGFGVYKDIGLWMFDILIDIRGIDVFYSFQIDSTVIIGSNMTLNNLIELFEANADNAAVPYFAPFASHLKQVATHTVRNLASWAGSLMLKHHCRDFVSDIFTLFETVGATLLIGDGQGSEELCNLTQFLDLDMRGKVIVSAVLPKFEESTRIINTYRVSPRLQNCHGYVTAGFHVNVDASRNFTVLEKPCLVYQGINSDLNHATETEAFLKGKQLGDPEVLSGAMKVLGGELKPSMDPVLASPVYRRSLAQALLYKFMLQVCRSTVDPRFQSGATMLERPVSSGVQTYGTHPEEWPLTQPLTKRDAQYQVTGELQYLDDESLAQGELFAAFVISSVGNATIDNIDPSEALKMPGVLKFLSAVDIPEGGENNFMPQTSYSLKEEIFSSGEILYAGQPVGLIVADDAMTAETAASAVKVTYKDIKPPLLDLRSAIDQKSFFPGAVPDPLLVGDPDGAIANSACKISGSIECGTQYHFQLETQIARCIPGDDGGMFVQAATQWIDGTEEIVAKALNLPLSSITVEVKRLGGAFGSKISRNFQVSGACALAAYIMRRPVRLRLGFHTNMKSIGKRFPFLADYQAGFTNEGKLNGVKIQFFADCGSSPNENSLPLMYTWMDNAYFCENWNFTPQAVQTNKPSSAYCRSPGSVPAQFIMESIMEHVAKSLNKDPTAVRTLNLYVKGQKTAHGFPLEYCNIRAIVEQLKQSAELETRTRQVQEFNEANRWKKRGLSLVPTRFGLVWAGAHYNVYVAIYHSDGTIAISHGGVEVGQGIHQKLCQVCAYELGVPLDLIRVKKGSTVTNANSITTGGSITSELNAMGVIKCCEILKQRMAPVRAEMTDPTWRQLVTKCYVEGVDLCARFYTNPQDTYDCHYNVYGAAVAEAELDVLTGQSQLRRVDLLYDCGESINPEIDIGQVEGGFVMGLGYHLTEKMKFDPTTGEALTHNTWEYKPPMPKDIPVDFRIALLKDAPNPLGVLGSKASGEPPLVMATSALFAVKHATEAARAEIGQDTFYPLDSPALVENVQTVCLTNAAQFTYR